MKGRKPNLTVVSGPQDSGQAAPAWLPRDAKAEWSVAVANLASRGLLFRGSFGTLASYCVCIAAIRQRQAAFDRDPTDRDAFTDQMKAVAKQDDESRRARRQRRIELDGPTRRSSTTPTASSATPAGTTCRRTSRGSRSRRTSTRWEAHAARPRARGRSTPASRTSTSTTPTARATTWEPAAVRHSRRTGR